MRRPVVEESATITLGTTHLSYVLRRSKRRSVGLQISDRGLVVTAPLKIAHTELIHVLKEREVWILSRLSYWRQCQARMASLSDVIQKNLPLPVAGKPHTVEFEPSLKRSILNEHNQSITLNQPKPSHSESLAIAAKEIEKLLRQLAKMRFAKIANKIAQRKNFPPFSIHITSARCRWGSCNQSGELRLNWRLMFYSDYVIEYVIAHEMAHLFEMNHSPKFWDQVAEIMPDYEKVHHYLNEMNPNKVPLI